MILEDAGYAVTLAADGFDAIEKLRAPDEGRFDLILTDVMMPHLTGYDLCRRVKQDSELSDVPIVLVTSLDTASDVFQGLQCGADSYLLKPYCPDYLVQRLRSVLDSPQLEPGEDGLVTVAHAGQSYRITARPKQILSFLVSTFDDFLQAQARELDTRLKEETQRLAAQAALEREQAVQEKARALALSEARYRQLVETAQVIPWEASLHGGLTFIGPQVEDVLGYPPQSLLEPGRWERLAQEDEATVDQLHNSDSPTLRLEYRVRAKDGRLVWLRDHSSQVKLPSGEVRYCGFMVDITALKEAEQQALAAQQLLQSALDALAEHIAVLDADGVVVAVNDAWRRFGGENGLTSPESCIGESYLDVCAQSGDDAAEAVARQIQDVRSGGEPGEPVPYSCHAPAEERWFVARVSRCPGPGPLRLLVSHENVTRSRAAEAALADREAQLRHAQKMEAIGRLAGGIAHDFNNLLTVISGYTDLLLEHTVEDERLQGYAARVRKASTQAEQLTSQLLAFSRKQVLAPAVVDLNSAVEQLLPLLRPLLGAGVEVQVQLNAGPATVRADPGQLHQLLMNLAVNARDAMSGAGRMTFLTRTVEVVSADERDFPEFSGGRCVQLSVSDDGDGMSVETRQRIFEPFFTTKNPGEGTGLGLATVYGIVKQSLGCVRVESELGRGTTFHVLLPCVDAQPSPAGVSDDLEAPLPATGGVILLAEDDPEVREFAKEILAKHGYRVVAPETSPGALLLLERPELPVDLLLTDVVMPELDGAALAARGRALRPSLPVLFMSGVIILFRMVLSPEFKP